MSAISVYRGDDHTLTLTFTDGTNAIDITGYTVFFTVKNESDTGSDDANAIISKTVTSHSDPTNGITTVTLTDSDTDITPTIYKYDIQTKDTSDNISTIVVGAFTVTDDVTKRTT